MSALWGEQALIVNVTQHIIPSASHKVIQYKNCVFVFLYFSVLYFCTFCTFVLCHLVGQTKYQCNFPYNIKAFRILLLQWHVKEKVPKTCVPPTFSGLTDYTPQVWVRQNPPPSQVEWDGLHLPHQKVCIWLVLEIITDNLGEKISNLRFMIEWYHGPG